MPFVIAVPKELAQGEKRVATVPEVVRNFTRSGHEVRIEHDAGLSGASVEVFEGSSKELGVICGKPFPIMALVIKS